VSFLIADLVHVCVAGPDDGLHNGVLIKDNIDVELDEPTIGAEASRFLLE
jgi:hypothetical protein